MKLGDVIYVAGHGGMVGSALVRGLKRAGYAHLLTRTHAELDLTDQRAVRAFFEQERPAHVFLAAARVGGIHANNAYPAQFIHENLIIQDNIIHSAHACGVKRLLFLGSSCIYPKLAPQPLREEHLLTGPLEPTNEPYALAKIAGIKTCEAYNRQYGTMFAAVMPTNLYGPGDNFHPENAHVIPALLRRFHDARMAGALDVTVWGTGQARREFLHVDDMAAACLHVMTLPEELFRACLCSYPAPCFVNVGVGADMSIAELAQAVAEVVGYGGGIRFDADRLDGTPAKLLDASWMQGMGWQARIDFRRGLAETYAWFLENQGRLRG